MANYKLVYIDEQQDDADEFKDFIELKDPQSLFEVEHLYPAATLEDMLANIIDEAPDAVISDFQLNEHIKEIGYNVPYNGMELVKRFLEIRDSFPCFVMTSFAAQAATASEDVNIVYIKGILKAHGNNNDPKDINFLERIKIQVDHYKNRIESAEVRLEELLILNDQSPLDINQEKELITLDSFLEASVDNRTGRVVPEDLKFVSNTHKLSELLVKVDALISGIKSK